MQRKSTLPHALLLRGRAGIGKYDFAIELSRALLCSQPNHNEACGGCPSCLWFNEGTHPDFRLISPENDDENEEAPKKKTAKLDPEEVLRIKGSPVSSLVTSAL